MQKTLIHTSWVKTRSALVKWKKDLLHLIYPEMCLICEVELPNSETQLCHLCETSLRYTYYETFKEPSSLDKLFWGRVALNATFSLLHFEKDTSTQDILHHIKYKNSTELAKEMGVRIGKKLLLNSEKYGAIDVLIPSPIHPKKRYLRGYNQSEIIAMGISKVIDVPVNIHFLTKNIHTESQTKKGKFSRWDNVSDVFEVNSGKLKHIKHLALVDDVVTTGSTLEANVRRIRQVLPNIQITIVCLASTK